MPPKPGRKAQKAREATAKKAREDTLNKEANKRIEDEQLEIFRLPSFESRISRIDDIKLDSLHKLIKEVSHPDKVDYQEQVIIACLKRILNCKHVDEKKRRDLKNKIAAAAALQALTARKKGPGRPKRISEAAVESDAVVPESSLDQLPRMPKPAQIASCTRMVFARQDVLLTAATGFGKSLVLHAMALLTNKITLQITPLDTLGNDQFRALQQLPGVRPCFLNSRTRKETAGYLERIKNGHYTHIILGPEQASSSDFRDLLKEEKFRRQIGMVAIDEIHLVKQWGDKFRPEFSMINQLRTLLPPEVIWFGCSATLNKETTKLVLRRCGFRPVGDLARQTFQLRTSIDRPDTAYSVLPIPKGTISTFDSLFFTVRNSVYRAVPTSIEEGQPDFVRPQEIRKTIIFIDDIKMVNSCADKLRRWLLALCNWSDARPKYRRGGPDARLDVYNIVQTFNSRVSAYDQSERFKEFLKHDSNIRIFVATTSLGTGVNIPGVQDVINYGHPIDETAGEAAQRGGRGGRGGDASSRAIFLFPHWAFDSVCRDKPNAAPLEKTGKEKLAEERANAKPRKKNTMSNRLPSKLSQHVTRDDINRESSQTKLVDKNPSTVPVDNQSEEQSASQSITSQADGESSNPVNEDEDSSVSGCTDEPPPGISWRTDPERRMLQKLSPFWREWCVATCKRKVLNLALGEDDCLPWLTSKGPPEGQCCNGCSPENAPIISPPPDDLLPKPPSEPRKDSQLGKVLEDIQKWCVKQNEEDLSPYAMCLFPSDAFMEDSLCLELARLLVKKGDNGRYVARFSNEELSRKELKDLVELVPSLKQWSNLDEYGARLTAFIKELGTRMAQRIVKDTKRIQAQEILKERRAQLERNEENAQRDGERKRAEAIETGNRQLYEEEQAETSRRERMSVALEKVDEGTNPEDLLREVLTPRTPTSHYLASRQVNRYDDADVSPKYSEFFNGAPSSLDRILTARRNSKSIDEFLAQRCVRTGMESARGSPAPNEDSQEPTSPCPDLTTSFSTAHTTSFCSSRADEGEDNVISYDSEDEARLDTITKRPLFPLNRVKNTPVQMPIDQCALEKRSVDTCRELFIALSFSQTSTTLQSSAALDTCRQPSIALSFSQTSTTLQSSAALDTCRQPSIALGSSRLPPSLNTNVVVLGSMESQSLIGIDHAEGHIASSRPGSPVSSMLSSGTMSEISSSNAVMPSKPPRKRLSGGRMKDDSVLPKEKETPVQKRRMPLANKDPNSTLSRKKPRLLHPALATKNTHS